MNFATDLRYEPGDMTVRVLTFSGNSLVIGSEFFDKFTPFDIGLMSRSLSKAQKDYYLGLIEDAFSSAPEAKTPAAVLRSIYYNQVGRFYE